MGPAKGLQISFSKIWALQKGFQKMYRSLKTRLDCHKGKQHSPREKMTHPETLGGNGCNLKFTKNLLTSYELI